MKVILGTVNCSSLIINPLATDRASWSLFFGIQHHQSIDTPILQQRFKHPHTTTCRILLAWLLWNWHILYFSSKHVCSRVQRSKRAKGSVAPAQIALQCMIVADSPFIVFSFRYMYLQAYTLHLHATGVYQMIDHISDNEWPQQQNAVVGVNRVPLWIVSSPDNTHSSPTPESAHFLVPWLQKRRNIAASSYSSLFIAIHSVSTTTRRGTRGENAANTTVWREDF